MTATSKLSVNQLSPFSGPYVTVDALGPVSGKLPITNGVFKGPAYDVTHPDFAGGAKGDGATDDSAAFQAAITAALANNAAVYVPPSPTPYIVTNVQATGGSASSILSFVGDGHGTVVKLKAGAATCVFFITGIAGVLFEGLTVDGNRANCPAGLAVIRSDVSDTMVRGCKIQNGNADAIFITPDGVNAPINALRVTVIGNHFLNCGSAAYGGVGLAAEQVQSCVVSGNVAEGTGGGLCDIEPIGAASASDTIAIVGNTVKNTQGYGIPGAIMVTSVNATNPVGTGVNAVDHVVIAGNVVNGTLNGQAGICVQSGRRALVTGNYVYSASGHGILVDAAATRESTNVSVFGNVVIDPSAGAAGSDGIRLNNAQSCAVAGNTVVDTRGGHLMNYAVRETGTSTGNWFGPVFASGANSEAFALVGTPGTMESAGPWAHDGLFRVRAQGASRYRADFNRTSVALNINAFDDVGGVFHPIVFGTNWADTVQALGGTATPSVLGGNAYTVGASGTAVTDFSSGTDGQEITLQFTGARTITHNGAGPIKLNAGANFVGAADNTLTLKRFSGIWYEKGRKV